MHYFPTFAVYLFFKACLIYIFLTILICSDLRAYQKVIGITLPSAAKDAKMKDDCTRKFTVLEKAKLGPLSGRQQGHFPGSGSSAKGSVFGFSLCYRIEQYSCKFF
jgi:hypothetical protein